MKPGITLKKGKEAIFHNRHLWIFSGAIERFPESFTNGAIYPIYSHEKTLLGHGYFNKGKSLCGRIVAIGSQDPHEAIRRNLEKAVQLRAICFDLKKTSAYRLVHGEADFLPGLVIDQYGDYLVLQSNALGIDLLKEEIVAILLKMGKWKGIFEKSSSVSRREEQLKENIGVLYGEDKEELDVLENGLKFRVHWRKGQKTGFFLDQREMREEVRSLSFNKRVGNCFSYSGGFSVYALAGGAKHVDSIDISEKAIDWAKMNCQLNGFSEERASFYTCDAFKFLEENPLDYDLLILDPPAFAKKKQDIPQATKGYREINTIALSKLPSRSMLLTCSCSYHIDKALFQTILFQAAKAAKREVQIIGEHRLGKDHPINLFHPEGNYLKSLLLYIN